MYIEAMASLPKNGDASEFERSLQNAKAVGAICVRAASLSGRRYETFSSLKEWQEFVKAERPAASKRRFRCLTDIGFRSRSKTTKIGPTMNWSAC